MSNAILNVSIDGSTNKIVVDIEEPGINAVTLMLTPADAARFANRLVDAVVEAEKSIRKTEKR